eukprot:g3530.t1
MIFFFVFLFFHHAYSLRLRELPLVDPTQDYYPGRPTDLDDDTEFPRDSSVSKKVKEAKGWGAVKQHLGFDTKGFGYDYGDRGRRDWSDQMGLFSRKPRDADGGGVRGVVFSPPILMTDTEAKEDYHGSGETCFNNNEFLRAMEKLFWKKYKGDKELWKKKVKRPYERIMNNESWCHALITQLWVPEYRGATFTGEEELRTKCYDLFGPLCNHKCVAVAGLAEVMDYTRPDWMVDMGHIQKSGGSYDNRSGEGALENGAGGMWPTKEVDRKDKLDGPKGNLYIHEDDCIACLEEDDCTLQPPLIPGDAFVGTPYFNTPLDRVFREPSMATMPVVKGNNPPPSGKDLSARTYREDGDYSINDMAKFVNGKEIGPMAKFK